MSVSSQVKKAKFLVSWKEDGQATFHNECWREILKLAKGTGYFKYCISFLCLNALVFICSFCASIVTPAGLMHQPPIMVSQCFFFFIHHGA